MKRNQFLKSAAATVGLSFVPFSVFSQEPELHLHKIRPSIHAYYEGEYLTAVFVGEHFAKNLRKDIIKTMFRRAIQEAVMKVDPIGNKFIVYIDKVPEEFFPKSFWTEGDIEITRIKRGKYLLNYSEEVRKSCVRGREILFPNLTREQINTEFKKK